MLSLRAIENIERLIGGQLAGEYSLEVVDVVEQPELAERDRIFATPTLVRLSPLPVRKLIGDLSDRAKVLGSLELFNDDQPVRSADAI